MSEIKTVLDFIDNHFLKLCIGWILCTTLFLGGSCYSFNKALDSYNEKNKVEHLEKVESK